VASTCEHGIAGAAYESLRRIKQSFDPLGIMNPEKIVDFARS